MLSLKPIEYYSTLSKADFFEQFYMRKPVVVHESNIPKWDLKHLVSRVGDAQVNVNIYNDDPSDYTNISIKKITIKEFGLHMLIKSMKKNKGQQHEGKPIYLFNDPSCIFARDESKRLIGWGETINNGLAPLWEEFIFPSFLRKEDFAFAMLIVGSSDNATRYHFDWGGNAKALIQVSGRKHVRVFPPSEACHFNMNSMFLPSNANVTTGQMDLVQSDAQGFEIELEPGNVLYWPAFWIHDIKNIDDEANIAVALSLAELPMHPLFMRHLSGEMLRRMLILMNIDLENHDGITASNPISLAQHIKLSYGKNQLCSFSELFSHFESFLLSQEYKDYSRLLEWNNLNKALVI